MINLGLKLIQSFFVIFVLYFGNINCHSHSETKLDLHKQMLAKRILSYFLESNSLQPSQYHQYTTDYKTNDKPVKTQSTDNINENQLFSKSQNEQFPNDADKFTQHFSKGKQPETVQRQSNLGLNFATHKNQKSSLGNIVLSRMGNRNSQRRIVLNGNGNGQVSNRVILRGSSSKKLFLNGGTSSANIVLRGSGNALRNIIVQGGGNSGRRIILKGSGNVGRNIIVRTRNGPVIRIFKNIANRRNNKSNRDTFGSKNLAFDKNTAIQKAFNQILQNTISRNFLKNGQFQPEQNVESNYRGHQQDNFDKYSNSLNDDLLNKAFLQSNLPETKTSIIVTTTHAPVETTEIEEPELP